MFRLVPGTHQFWIIGSNFGLQSERIDKVNFSYWPNPQKSEALASQVQSGRSRIIELFAVNQTVQYDSGRSFESENAEVDGREVRK